MLFVLQDRTKMPISFQFKDRLTGERMSLSIIDEEICKLFEKESHPTFFSAEYEIITDIGIACCFNGPFSFKRFQEITQSLETEIAHKILHFLDGKYLFDCWR